MDSQKTDVDPFPARPTAPARHPERSKTGAGKCEEKQQTARPFRITERAAAEPQRFRKENSPYEEGIYYGNRRGAIWGDITTAVVIQDETIKAILVTESEDDEAFLKRAKQTAKDVVKNQTLEVDTVSGATYSPGEFLRQSRKL